MNSKAYCEFTIPLVKDLIKYYLDQYDVNLVYQHDNAPIHVSKYSVEKWDYANIDRMDWPANSPDLNSIE